MAPRSLVAALALAACGGDAAPIVAPPTPAVRFANGAASPILATGQSVVLEGLGFGTTRGSGIIRFTATGGGTVEAVVGPDDWSDRYITTAVPPGSASGPISVVTDAGRTLRLPVTIATPPTFDPRSLTWVARTPLPRPNAGIAAAVGQALRGSELQTFVLLAGGAAAGESTKVYVGFADPSGTIPAWEPRGSLPAPRAYAAAVTATPHTTRRASTPALYLIGGVGAAGDALSSVIAATIAMPGAIVGEWVPVAPLPQGVVAPRATLANGMIYVTGGTDASGRPSAETYVARVREDGALEGWFPGPRLPVAHAHHGLVAAETLAVVFGGTADTISPVATLDTLEPRRAGSAHTSVSRLSGFFTAGSWTEEGGAFAQGRSRFASITAGQYVLAVGGLYAGAGRSLAETVAAVRSGGSLGPFGGAVGTNTIAGLSGVVSVAAAAVSWHDLTGRAHGLLLGGFDLVTGRATNGAWGF